MQKELKFEIEWHFKLSGVQEITGKSSKFSCKISMQNSQKLLSMTNNISNDVSMSGISDSEEQTSIKCNKSTKNIIPSMNKPSN